MKTRIAVVLLLTLVCSIYLFPTVLNKINKGVDGNGKVISKEIVITDYSKITMSSITNLVYEQNSNKSPYLRVEIDENLVNDILIEVVGGNLHIGSQRGKNIKTKKYKVYTNSKALTELTLSGVGNATLNGDITSQNLKISLSGVGDIKADNIDTKKVDVYLSGVGNVILGGKSNNASFSVSGKGNIKALNLESQDADCSMSGVGNIELDAVNVLNARMSGVGNIRYKSSPKNIKVSKSGIGSVKAI